MKSSLLTRMWVVLILGLTFANAALAKSDPREHPPAAPEPGVLTMAVAGLVLGGVYLLWRCRHKHGTTSN